MHNNLCFVLLRVHDIAAGKVVTPTVLAFNSTYAISYMLIKERTIIMEEEVKKVLDAVRPALQADGGDVELIEVTADGVVKVRLKGACGSCPMSQMTLKMGIERKLREMIPEIAEVEQVL